MDQILRAIEALESYTFNTVAPKNKNLIYFFKSCLIFFFGTFMAGYVFTVVEGQLEKEIKSEVYPRLKRHLARAIFDAQNDTTMEEAILRYEGIIAHYHRKFPLVMNHIDEQMWTLWTAFFYSWTIYTTLGYGEMYPITKVGRIFTMIYAIIGIPLFLLFLRDLGKLFTKLLKYIWSLTRRLYYTGTCRKVRTKKNDIFTDPNDDKLMQTDSVLTGMTSIMSGETPSTVEISTFEVDDEFNLPIPLALFILTVYIFSGAILYSYFEGWDVFSSFYYVFICLSTVGFGDVIPHNPNCEVVSMFYECFGKALMAMTIDMFSEKLGHSFEEPEKTESFIWSLDESEDSLEIIEIDDADMREILASDSKASRKSRVLVALSAFLDDDDY